MSRHTYPAFTDDLPDVMMIPATDSKGYWLCRKVETGQDDHSGTTLFDKVAYAPARNVVHSITVSPDRRGYWHYCCTCGNPVGTGYETHYAAERAGREHFASVDCEQ